MDTDAFIDSIEDKEHLERILNLTLTFSKEINYRKYNKFFSYEVILSYYAFFLILIGTFFNLISFVIMNRANMRKFACSRYLSALAISDLLVLYQWNLNTVFKYNLSKPPLYLDLEELSLASCRYIAFMAFFSLQSSAWFLSLVSFDRLMVVYLHCWKQYMHKPIRISMLILVVVSTLFIINSHLLFKNGYVIPIDINLSENMTRFIHKTYQTIIPTSDVVCYRSINDKKYIFPKWETAHLFLYSVIPFSIMCISNSLIIYNVKLANRVQSKVKASIKRKRRMTVMLILVTFSFVILTLPSVIVHTFFREHLHGKPYRRFVNLIVNNLLHTSHAINFFLYVLSAPNFRLEFVIMFKSAYNLLMFKLNLLNVNQANIDKYRRRMSVEYKTDAIPATKNRCYSTNYNTTPIMYPDSGSMELIKESNRLNVRISEDVEEIDNLKMESQ